jgi:DNA-binding MarR family transcriptional regulator
MATPTERLINEVRLLYQSMVQVGEAVHQGSNISMGMRAVLEYLSRNGDTTVPQIARARRVTRQRIQTLVNALLTMNLVAPTSNPASKRSPLISLTEKGANTILEMRRRESREMNLTVVSDNKVVEAADTLAELRMSLEAGMESRDEKT